MSVKRVYCVRVSLERHILDHGLSYQCDEHRDEDEEDIELGEIIAIHSCERRKHSAQYHQERAQMRLGNET